MFSWIQQWDFCISSRRVTSVDFMGLFCRTTFFMKENKSYSHLNFLFPLGYVMLIGLFWAKDSEYVRFASLFTEVNLCYLESGIYISFKTIFIVHHFYTELQCVTNPRPQLLPNICNNTCMHSHTWWLVNSCRLQFCIEIKLMNGRDGCSFSYLCITLQVLVRYAHYSSLNLL